MKCSILDLAPVRSGGSVGEAFRNTVDLAQRAEGWGFTRFWMAEHHNMPGIASAATPLLIGHVARETSRATDLAFLFISARVPMPPALLLA